MRHTNYAQNNTQTNYAQNTDTLFSPILRTPHTGYKELYTCVILDKTLGSTFWGIYDARRFHGLYARYMEWETRIVSVRSTGRENGSGVGYEKQTYACAMPCDDGVGSLSRKPYCFHVLTAARTRGVLGIIRAKMPGNFFKISALYG